LLTDWEQQLNIYLEDKLLGVQRKMVMWNTVSLFWLVGLQDHVCGLQYCDVERNRSPHVSMAVAIDLLCTWCNAVDTSIVYLRY